MAMALAGAESFHFRTLGFLFLSLCPLASPLGVNWGTISSDLVPPRVVVQLLRANNISKVKLFGSNPDILAALTGSSIEVMVGISNNLLQPFSASSATTDAWVRSNISRYIGKGGANIKYIAVGNEPFLSSYGGQFQNYTYPAMSNVYQSLVKAGLSDRIKVTVPCNADVLLNTLPSKGEFRPDVKDTMKQIVSLLSQTNAPFLVNIYPFLDLTQQSTFPEDFAFFDGTSHPLLDGTVTYHNVLDASYDMTIVALENIGFSGVQVTIGEIGWPTDGSIYASVSNAQKFNQGLLKHIMSKQASPLRAGTIDTYLFSLLDENQKSTLPGNFERHWGIFTFDGQAKYELDLTGQGLNTTLVNAENVPYLPTRWCIANPTKNASDLVLDAAFACSTADCTALAVGGSCSKIGAPASASYAFNSYYQLHNQDASSCFFNGSGLVTFVDPSIGNCRFLIGVSNSSYAASRSFFAVIFLGLIIFRLALL